MKKLMLMVAMAVAAVVTNAATTNWKLVAGNVYGANGSKYTGEVLVYCAGIGDAGTDVQVTTATVNNGIAGFSFSSDLFAANSVYDFYFTITDSGKMFTSYIKTDVMALETGTASIQFGNMASATQNTSNWVGSAVPEPTSGFMLLLGMASLALKRKRA